MSILPSRTTFPELVDWFEEPFLTLRRYVVQPIRVDASAEAARGKDALAPARITGGAPT
jgi:hypothetical protein